MPDIYLDEAVKPEMGGYKKTELTLGRGGHLGYFIGLGEVNESVGRCKGCNGSGKFSDGNPHQKCNGTGRATEKKVSLDYQMSADLIEHEWVNYSLEPAGKLRDGTTKSATTLYRRMRTFFPNIEGKAELAAAYRSWKESGAKRIPIEMYVGDNNNQTALVIRDVTLHVKKATPPPSPDVDDSFLRDLD